MNKPKISLIAAVAKNLAIGKNNQLLWHIPEDLRHFKEKTQGHAIIMGSRTFESLGKPLPKRTNIVMAKDQSYQAPGCILVHSIEEALFKATEAETHSNPRGTPKIASRFLGKPRPPLPLQGGGIKGEGEIFIIGGGSIYKQFLPLADKLYITLIDKEYEADTFFPPYEDFKKLTFRQEGEFEGLKYVFLELER